MSEDVLYWNRPKTRKELHKIRSSYNLKAMYYCFSLALILTALAFFFVPKTEPWALGDCLFFGLILFLFSLYKSVKYSQLNKNDSIKFQELTTTSYHDYYRLMRLAGKNRLIREQYKKWLTSEVGLLRGDYIAADSYLRGSLLKERVMAMGKRS